MCNHASVLLERFLKAPKVIGSEFDAVSGTYYFSTPYVDNLLVLFQMCEMHLRGEEIFPWAPLLWSGTLLTEKLLLPSSVTIPNVVTLGQMVLT